MRIHDLIRVPKLTGLIGLILVVTSFTSAALPSAWSQNSGPPVLRRGSDRGDPTLRLAREVRHELVMLSWYGVFDWIEGTVTPDANVTLRGWVIRPTTKSDAERRVKDIESVVSVRNEIRVLPLSPSDDQLRRSLYFSLFGSNSPLFRYALGVNPSIHIIVDNGRVTLKGVVSSKVDRAAALARANAVSGIFEVKNELVIEEATS